MQEDDLQAAPLGGDAEVEPGVALLRGVRPGEERVAPVGSRRREDVHRAPAEQGADLPLGPAHGRRGGHDLGPDDLVAHRAGGQLVKGRLVQPDHRAHRPGDQVQLVLDDQVGRRQRGGQRQARARLARPVEALPVVVTGRASTAGGRA